jgi:hypothetical protein
MDALVAWMPPVAARGLCYLLAVGALVACYGIWSRLTAGGRAGGRDVALPAAVAAVALLLPLLLRDLDDCGLQVFLMFFASLGGWALVRGKPIQAGCWLGTAAAYKLTPLLFLPLLLWKRQWRAAGGMMLCLAAWQLAPAVWLGWNNTLEAHQQFVARTLRTMSAGEAYPSLQEAEPPKPHNLSLQATVARYVETYPPGHPLNLEHPAFLQFGALGPLAAQRVVQGTLLCLAVVLAWRFRRPWDEHFSRLPAEWAMACLLCALLAPLCWKHHLVVALPALFLVVRRRLEGWHWPRWAPAAVALLAVVMWLTRHGLVGRELSVVLLSYKLITLALLPVLALALIAPSGWAATARQSAADKSHMPQAGTRRRRAA